MQYNDININYLKNDTLFKQANRDYLKIRCATAHPDSHPQMTPLILTTVLQSLVHKNSA